MKTKTISLALLITSMLVSQTLMAQDKQPLPKVREFGIGLTSLNSFSLQYHWGTENRLFRLAGSIGGYTTTSDGQTIDNSNSYLQESNNTKPINLNCGLNLSILKLKAITDKFSFLCGGMVAFNYYINQSNSELTTTTNNNGFTFIINSQTKYSSQSFGPSLGIVLGASYKINSSFILYAEVGPNLYYSYSTTTSTTTRTNNGSSSVSTSDSPSTSHTFGLSNLSNSGAMLTIVYRFSK
jgi:hypothetical protein